MSNEIFVKLSLILYLFLLLHEIKTNAFIILFTVIRDFYILSNLCSDAQVNLV